MPNASDGTEPSALDRMIEDAAHLVSVAHNVVVLTGAGISTDSGIPDFRGPQGVWTKQPSAERMATLEHYMADPEVRKQSWQSRLHHPIWLAQPNPAHLALVDLERTGRLHTLVTQNVDGLHQRAGSSRERIVEVHGTVHEVVCMRCGDRGSMLPVLERVRAGEADPECRKCGGILKSATISFGQALVPEVLERADCDSEWQLYSDGRACRRGRFRSTRDHVAPSTCSASCELGLIQHRNASFGHFRQLPRAGHCGICRLGDRV
jgi:NAD-dependent deacetylase